MSGSSCGFGDGYANPRAELLPRGDALADALDGGILIGFDGDVGADDDALT